MEQLPEVPIPLQGVGAPGPTLGIIKNGAGFVAESSAVSSKMDGKGLARAARPTASSALVLEPRRPARTPAVTVPLEMPAGKVATSMNSSSGGVSELAMRMGSHMPKVDVEK